MNFKSDLKIYILGISCFYHDSAAALLCDGDIISAAQEERFTRKKHDSSFPLNAIRFCLETNNIDLRDIKCIVYYEKPLLTFERLLETYLDTSPRGFRSFVVAMQTWVKKKLFLKSELKTQFQVLQKKLVTDLKPHVPELIFSEHHQSHAAAAFFPSPFNEAAILCMDGVGEWATTSLWIGNKNKIKPIWEISFPHSLGLLYSAFTSYCGFKVNSGEYKLMGLAPYGKPIYANKIKEHIINIKDDGTFRLDISYFKFHRGFTMTSRKFHKLFGSKPRKRESEIKQFHMDLASSIQNVTEEIIVKLVRSIKKETGIKNLCLGGGVALNCVANGKLSKECIFDDLWIQPASGDAGSALGSALIGWHHYLKAPRVPNPQDSMKGSFLGCEFTNEDIISYLKKIKAPFTIMEDEELFEKLAQNLDEGKVVGWFNGPMEFGPRALGGRSIIGDPRHPNMQSIMNLKIKYRESFRPFAPSVLEEDANSHFEIEKKSPYMLFVAPVKRELCREESKVEKNLTGIEKLKVLRSSLPAITHVDFSARIQTVSAKTNPRFHKLISAFKKKTACPILINTSFNVRGEPIVCTPKDAYQCFMRTEMDVLVLQNQILFKKNQPNFNEDNHWKKEFDLD